MPQSIESQTVRIRSIAVVLTFLASCIAGEVYWRVNVARDIEAIQGSLKVLENSIKDVAANKWNKSDMQLWVVETELLNTNWKGAEVKYRFWPH